MLNYSEPPFCKHLRDSDLSIIQHALLGLSSLNEYETIESEGKPEEVVEDDGLRLGCTHFVNLLLHRFGVFDFAGFGEKFLLLWPFCFQWIDHL